MRISVQILDAVRGRPAENVHVCLEMRVGATWTELGAVCTDQAGRATDWDRSALRRGAYRLQVDVARYYGAQGMTSCPVVTVHLSATDDTAGYHVPIMLTPFGSTSYTATET